MTSPAAANPATRANSAGRVRLEIGKLDDVTFSAVLSMVSRYPPFSNYSFGLMVERLREQLAHGANVMAIENGRLVAYAGWLRVQHAPAKLWQSGAGAMPPVDWAQGDAAIVTVTVAERRNLLAPLLHGISHVCAGVPVFRMRSFQDGRADIRRPAITGRHYTFS